MSYEISQIKAQISTTSHQEPVGQCCTNQTSLTADKTRLLLTVRPVFKPALGLTSCASHLLARPRSLWGELERGAMKYRTVVMYMEISSFVSCLSGWILVCSTLPTEYWTFSEVGTIVLTTANYYSNLWKDCVSDTTGVSDCKEYPSLMGLPGRLSFFLFNIGLEGLGEMRMRGWLGRVCFKSPL